MSKRLVVFGPLPYPLLPLWSTASELWLLAAVNVRGSYRERTTGEQKTILPK
jgi:hypothetical protein